MRFEAALPVALLLQMLVGSAHGVELRPVVISQGPAHACAVTGAGAAVCWGNNLGGELGDGTRQGTNVPVAVSGLGSGVVAIAAGESFSCALSEARAVVCWGAGADGRLGNGSAADSPTPTGVTGLSSGVRAIAAGGGHACALLESGEVRCWGRNDVGQLGNLSIASSSVPVTAIGAGSPAVAITAGVDHSCAVLSSGYAVCWGSNAQGKAGIGDPGGGFATAPTLVLDDHADFASIAAGSDHTCARTLKGRVRCWGANDRGQLGIGTTGGIEASPVELKTLRNVVAVAAGDRGGCALTSKGKVYCQGINDLGTLGIGTNVDSPRPVPMRLDDRAQAVATGGGVACAALASGEVRCAGDGSAGQLGGGTYDSSNEPLPVSSLAVRSDLPVLSSGDSAVVEGDSGIVRLPFARTLSRPARSGVEFRFDSYQGSASVFDPDFVSAAGDVRIPKGRTDLGKDARWIGLTINVYSDPFPEGDEDLYSVMFAPVGASLGRAAGRGVILNDDVAPSPALRVNLGDASVVEGDERLRTVNVPISLSAPATDARVLVEWKVTGGSAAEKVDFRTKKGTATLLPGDVGQMAFAAIKVAGDFVPELDETIEVTLSVRSGNAVPGRTVGTATILDDD